MLTISTSLSFGSDLSPQSNTNMTSLGSTLLNSISRIFSIGLKMFFDGSSLQKMICTIFGDLLFSIYPFSLSTSISFFTSLLPLMYILLFSLFLFFIIIIQSPSSIQPLSLQAVNPTHDAQKSFRTFFFSFR